MHHRHSKIQDIFKTLIVRVGGNAFAPIQSQLITTMHSYYFQTKVVQSKGWLYAMQYRIYDLWDGSLDKHKLRGLVTCCGQDGYRSQVPQHPIVSYRYISHHLLFFLSYFRTSFLHKNIKILNKVLNNYLLHPI